LSGYLQIPAARGFATVAIDFAHAIGQFPTPVRQTNAAVAHVIVNTKSFNIHPERILVVGDSAGAQIAAQTALIISDANYARRTGIDPGMKRMSLRVLCSSAAPMTRSP
jgi:acetyl esterase